MSCITFCLAVAVKHDTGILFFYEFADIQIIYAEILSPGREAMRFVNDESYDVAHGQNPLYGFGTQHLGSDVQ